MDEERELETYRKRIENMRACGAMMWLGYAIGLLASLPLAYVLVSRPMG